MKCCANCEWSISPELEDEIMEEQRYKEADPNRPHAGDCVILMNPDNNYYCESHQYIQGYEEFDNFKINVEANNFKRKILKNY